MYIFWRKKSFAKEGQDVFYIIEHRKKKKEKIQKTEENKFPSVLVTTICLESSKTLDEEGRNTGEWVSKVERRRGTEGGKIKSTFSSSIEFWTVWARVYRA